MSRPGLWDRAAERYDRQAWLERSSLRTALDLLAPVPSAAMLDVGTGTGLLLAELARRPLRPATVVGIDPSPAMLAHVGPLPDGWTVQQADGRALPFANDAFDLVSATWVLHVLDAADRRAVLGEIARVLRPGGRLIVVTPSSRALGLLSGLERFAGLRALDPRPDLVVAGLPPLATRRDRRGYPAVVVLSGPSGTGAPAAPATPPPRTASG